MANPSVSIPDDLLDKVDDELDYGDSRSEWIQEAIREKLERDTDGESNRGPAEVLAD